MNKLSFNSKIFNNFSKLNNFQETNTFSSKHDLNWILYSWLNTSKSNNDHIIEKLFESSLHKNLWTNYFDFFTKLYKLSFFLNKTNNINVSYNLNNTIFQITSHLDLNFNNTILKYLNNNPLSSNHTLTFLYYIINNKKNYFCEKNKFSNSTNFLKNRYEWNLNVFITEINKYSILLKNKNGLFFFDNFDYQKFSHLLLNFDELWSLNTFFENQINSAKWNRWLYKYSILHRKILKNSHKLTLIKKLINSGFYDSKLFNKNIWANSSLNTNGDLNHFNTFFNTFYKNLYNNKINLNSNHVINVNNNIDQKNSLNLLKFFENSYFWYLKRFYLFNTLNNNFIKSKLNFVNRSFNKKNNLLNDHFYIFSHLLNSSYLNLNDLTHTNNLNLKFNNIFNSPVFCDHYNFKDIYTLINENDFLSKDNVNVLYWLTTNSNNKNNLNFFNYLNFNYSTYYLKSSIFISLNSNKSTFNTNYWIKTSLIQVDNTYLNDVIYLSMFY